MKKITEYEGTSEKGIRLNANELSMNLKADILDEVCSAMKKIDYNRYPDDTQKELLDTYGRVIGMPESCLLAGNGSDQMLGYLIGSFLGYGKTLFTLDPDFGMYDYYASAYETSVRKYRNEGEFSIDEMIRQAHEAKADMIMFSNPHNPSGRFVDADGVVRILEEFPDIPVVVDEAYIEFADAPSAVSLTAQYPNLFVTRTLSKAYGLAGVRTGFLIGNEEPMQKLKKSFVPYALSTPAMKIAIAVLHHSDEYRPVIEKICQERERMYQAMKKMERITVSPSRANFLYGITDDLTGLLALMAKNSISIRTYRDGYSFRITVGTEEENNLVLNVLKQFEKENV